jgi:DNA-binding NtrC family response regulator
MFADRKMDSAKQRAEACSPRLALLGADGHVRTLGEIEAEVIYLTISECGGSVAKAAYHLRIGRSTLYRKLNGLAGSAQPQPPTSIV